MKQLAVILIALSITGCAAWDEMKAKREARQLEEDRQTCSAAPDVETCVIVLRATRKEAEAKSSCEFVHGAGSILCR